MAHSAVRAARFSRCCFVSRSGLDPLNQARSYGSRACCWTAASTSNVGCRFSSQNCRETQWRLFGSKEFQRRLLSSTTDLAKAARNVLVSKDGVEGRPIDFDVQSKIEGNESQIVTITLEPGQVLRAESGAMMYMTQGVEMNTTTGGGLSSGFQRMLTGQNFFISDYTYSGEDGTVGQVALGTDFPSKIVRLNVPEYGGKIVCQKGALLCASHNIDIQMEFSKNISTGFFGGEGFILQGLTGDGDVFVKAGGTLIRRDLGEGEKLRISSGCLVAFSNGVDYDVEMIKGFANVFAGGEGLFMTTLTGPGTVWLQGQPPERMISEISRRVPSGGPGLVIPVGVGGSGGSGDQTVSSNGGGDGSQ
ncbi:hypothetical protein ACA910_014613 [Epithemia clementina (nom. ined.)]